MAEVHKVAESGECQSGDIPALGREKRRVGVGLRGKVRSDQGTERGKRK